MTLFNYRDFFTNELAQLHREGRYRVFADLEREAQSGIHAFDHRTGRRVTIWCSNDYLSMGVHPEVIGAARGALEQYGAGAGGTRNISGTSHEHVLLERELADLHGKPSALLFTSGYVANDAALSSLGRFLPGCVIFSDALNHASMIAGIRRSGAEKRVFAHNDWHDLERQLASVCKYRPKLICFESCYSMDGDFAPMEAICDLAEEHNAFTYVDEVHAVGLYGARGAGVAERDGLLERIDMFQGTLSKGFGSIGGYIAGSLDAVDFVRSFAPGFIFSTALPPSVVAGIRAALHHLKEDGSSRLALARRTASLKARMLANGIPVLPSPSHILPVMIGDAALAKAITDQLMAEYGIYIQPINYPTVPRGTERLRITPTPLHTDEDENALVAALVAIRQDSPRWGTGRGGAAGQSLPHRGGPGVSNALLPVFQPASMLFDHGEGPWLTTVNGERYLDFGAGIAVNALGYSHPHLVRALERQGRKLWHLSNVYRISETERLAERLTAACFADVAFFANSGAEANECAIKIARRRHDAHGHPQRWRIITFEGAFHGRTLATMAAGGNRKYLDGFGPTVGGFDQCPLEDIEAVRARIWSETAAIMIEPIQGESGIRSVSHSFLRQLRELCDERGLLLIFDEIQCGMGRTGYLFAHQESGVVPDIMSLAKGLGGGFPIGACLATRSAAFGMMPGAHGSTFGGNPLAGAVANAVLDIVMDTPLLAEIKRKSDLLRALLENLAERYPKLIVEVRGRGLMLGIKTMREPQEIVEALRAHAKVLTIAAGDNVTRVLPPLIVTDEKIRLFAERCDETFAHLSKRAAEEA